jgi:outer membrane immunogenic protein
MKNRVAFLSGAMAAMFATGALGADLPMPAAPIPYVPPPPPAYNWTGFYVGVNGGYGWATADATTISALGLSVTENSSGNANGGVAGGQIGANFQFDHLVLGIEGDFDWSGQKNTTTVSCGFLCSLTNDSEVKWLATVRGRIGAAFDRVLVYGTGGVAWTDVSKTITGTTVGFNGTVFDASSVNTGWTAGGGVEIAALQNLTVRAEYLYVQTNATLNGNLLGLVNVGLAATVHDSIIRAGINVKFP